LKQLGDPVRKKLQWRWSSGDDTVHDDFGVPDDDTDYVLCIYTDDGAGAELATDLVVGAGSRWSATGSGFQYRDPAASRDGVKGIKLVAKSRSRGSIKLKAAGATLPLNASTIAAGAAVTVQWVSSDGVCWEGGA
jgi:hypothetical protein